MSSHRTITGCLAALLTLTAGLLSAAGTDEAPEWVRQAAASVIPSYPAKVSSVVLLADESVVVDVDGRRVMRERGAVKILQRGNQDLRAYRTYNVKSGKIRSFQGWLISPSGKSTAYGLNSVLDVALSTGSTYDEDRAKMLECGAAAAGSVFAWEVVEEEKTVFTQYYYHFQNGLPALVSRFALTLPAGWEAKGIIFNHATLEPEVNGNTYKWELRDLPWIEREDHSPTLSALAPRLMVSYFPPSGNRAGLKGLKDWTAVSAWLSPLVDPAADVTEALRVKARQLTAGAPRELDKIRDIAAFTQKTSYVDISLNITRGGGYTPHRADETLARNYGDCKDKATLMRALLKAVGIDSYLVTISADDRTYVRPEWASPMQFNHAIIAVKVSNAITLPTVIENASLGRLMIFDPTDPITPPGDLPQEEQGSHALVIAGEQGALLTMPVLAPALSRIDSTVQGAINADGLLEAQMQRQYFGQSSITLRGTEMLRGGDEVRKRFERVLARRVPGSVVGKVSTEVQPDGNSLSAHLELSAERFGQSMQNRLFIIRPGLLTSGGDYFFTSKQRTAPVELSGDLRHDSIRLKLPAGFKADEVPHDMRIESPYGTATASWAVRGDEIVMEMTLEVREMVVPASGYAGVRDFFDRVTGAQGAAIVLVKQ